MKLNTLTRRSLPMKAEDEEEPFDFAGLLELITFLLNLIKLILSFFSQSE